MKWKEMNEWMNERMNEVKVERKEWMNEWMSRLFDERNEWYGLN